MQLCPDRGDDDAARRACEVLEPLREVHGVADHRVFESLIGPDVTGNDLTGRHSQAGDECCEGPESHAPTLRAREARRHEVIPNFHA